jgi:hypothetical protein
MQLSSRHILEGFYTGIKAQARVQDWREVCLPSESGRRATMKGQVAMDGQNEPADPRCSCSLRKDYICKLNI